MRTAGGKGHSPRRLLIREDGPNIRLREMEHISSNTHHYLSDGMTGWKGQSITRRRHVSTGIDGYDSGDRYDCSSSSQSVTSGIIIQGKALSAFNTHLNAYGELDTKNRRKQQAITQTTAATSIHRHNPLLVQPTWHIGNHGLSSILLSDSAHLGLACANRSSNYDNCTRNLNGIVITCRSPLNQNCYKSRNRNPLQITLALVPGESNIRSSEGKHNRAVMEGSGSRSATAIQDLNEARKGYETRAAARHKRKVDELEDKVKQEEDGRTEEEIAAEVDWLPDPGTPAKRATQFVRTKAESWRTKTLIAKALEAMEKERPRIITEVNLTDAQMAKILDFNNSLEGRINRAQEAIQVVDRKLTLLCRLLKDTINQGPGATQTPNASVPEKDEDILKDMQARVKSHVAHMGLDTISLMGKHI